MLCLGFEDRTPRVSEIAATGPALFHPHGPLPPNLPHPTTASGFQLSIALTPTTRTSCGLNRPDWPRNAPSFAKRRPPCPLCHPEGPHPHRLPRRRHPNRYPPCASPPAPCAPRARPAAQRARAGLGRGEGRASRGCPRRLPAFPEPAHDRSRHHLRRLHAAPERTRGHARTSGRGPTTGDCLGAPRAGRSGW